MSELFTFSTDTDSATFKGSIFYDNHKNDKFLKNVDQTSKILKQCKELKKRMQTVKKENKISACLIRDNTSLVIRYGGAPNLTDDDYTVNRLQGMVAAYISQNKSQYTEVIVALAKFHGLASPNMSDDYQVKAYLSFAPDVKFL